MTIWSADRNIEIWVMVWCVVVRKGVLILNRYKHFWLFFGSYLWKKTITIFVTVSKISLDITWYVYPTDDIAIEDIWGFVSPPFIKNQKVPCIRTHKLDWNGLTKMTNGCLFNFHNDFMYVAILKLTRNCCYSSGLFIIGKSGLAWTGLPLNVGCGNHKYDLKRVEHNPEIDPLDLPQDKSDVHSPSRVWIRLCDKHTPTI